MKIGIVGLGLIGGSIGMGLRAAGHSVVGYDRSIAEAETALKRGCVQELADLKEVLATDAVFVSVPPDAISEVLDLAESNRNPHTVVTDCASVKGPVVAWAKGKNAPWFIGGHPMAGHEKSGSQYASAWLFRNAPWILCPTESSSKETRTTVSSLISDLGALPTIVEANDHDQHVAVLSHLPHAVAAVLVQMGAELSKSQLSGGSWKDFTRVGGVDPELWTQIMIGNREALAAAIRQTTTHLEELASYVEAGDAKTLKKYLTASKQAKSKLDKTKPI